METSTAILVTQLPIAAVILLGAWELFRIRKEIGSLVSLLKKRK